MAASGSPTAASLAACTQLVVVCCHAVYVGDGINTAEDQWLLQSFQASDAKASKPSEHHTMIAHIAVGAMAVDADPRALLMFSGGRTTHSERSEAEGYEKIFLAMVDVAAGAKQRYALEQYATDSYQNLLFSTLRFIELVGRPPSNIVVVTHAFKESRFLDLHAPAIRWPASRIRVQGLNPPFTAQELRETTDGETARGYAPFSRDLYGVKLPSAAKRLQRNWESGTLDLLASNHDDNNIRALLKWDGGQTGTEVFPHRLPWESR